MYRDPSTTTRRLRWCRVFEGPFAIPTLRAAPPPPPPPSRTPVMMRRTETSRPRHTTPVVFPRAAAGRRMHDCVFVSDIRAAVEIAEARRRVALVDVPAAARARAPREARAPRSPRFAEALAVGLLMMIAPPLAVTLAWASPTFSTNAKIALTAYGALVTVLVAIVAIAALG